MNANREEARGGGAGTTLGGLYAMLLTVLGVMLPVIFFVEGNNTDNGLYLAIFHIYIYTVSLFFLLYLQCCLMTKRRNKSLDRVDSVDFDALEDAGFKDTLPCRGTGGEEEHGALDDVDSRPLDAPADREDAQPFAFTGEGVNFFLRFGFIVLGMGSVVLDGFRLLQFVETKSSWLCYGQFYLTTTVLRLVFIFAETFFIFKNHKLVVNFKKSFVKFGLVHMVATNLCTWAMVVIAETTESYKLLHENTASFLSGSPVVLPTEGPTGKIDGPMYMNISTQLHRLCHGQPTLGDKAAPYLYPCSVQFCILAAAVLMRIFLAVGGSTWRVPHVPSGGRHQGVCHKANTGLFLGLVVVVVTCIVTCFYLLDRAGHLPLDKFITTLIFFSNDLVVLALSLLVVLVAFCKLRRLSREDLTDRFNQTLLLVGVAGYYAFYMCVLVPAVGTVTELGMGGLSAQLLVVVCALAAIQATAQVTFVVDALRRRSTSRQHFKSKPGRSLITFLLICNLAMWIIDAFQLRELHTSAMLRGYYGNLAWQILIHLLLPMAVLFRFHSAVCFADIWGKAYKKRPNHNISFTHSETDENNRRGSPPLSSRYPISPEGIQQIG